MSLPVDISEIKGLALHSGDVQPGYLFAALPGESCDGRDFITEAIGNGASYILLPEESKASSDTLEKPDIQLIYSENPRKDLSLLAAAFYGEQPEFIAAVTGTNGKSSVVHFARQIWEELGYKTVSIGTLGVHGAGVNMEGHLTTPDPLKLHQILADMARRGITHVALEASSHGLAQFRLDGVRVKAAAFTNLSREHLDYHEEMSSYLNSKLRLFSELLDEDGMAVLNADIPEYKEILTAAGGQKTVSYGRNGRDIKILDTEPDAHGQQVSLEILERRYDFRLPLVGEFQLYNVLCALGLVVGSLKRPPADLLSLLPSLKPVPGRVQFVSGHPTGAGIYVDYAHTPGALESVLHALRPHTQGKLICLFGCGGERDPGKRPEMGKVARQYADRVIVSDDNPRGEDPARIRQEIRAGCPDALEIGNRHKAIRIAVKDLEEGDVLLIAGKGHEQGQVIAGRTEPFDDVHEVKKAIKAIKGERK